MLFVPQSGNDFSAVLSYGTTRPVATGNFGTAITPGTGAAYGAYTQVGSDLTQDCYGLFISVNNVFLAGTFRQAAIQIGVDYAGGTTFTTIAQDIMVSQANAYGGGGGILFYFPLFIPVGAAVAVAARASTATTFGVAIRYMTAPPNPTMVKRGSYIEPLGITLGTGTVTGVSVTPGTTAEGAWTLIGTTTKRCWHWQFSCQHSDTTMTVLTYHLDIAVGDTTTVGDPKDIISSDTIIGTGANETFSISPLITGVEKYVPAGKTIWARVQNSGANENAGTFQVAVYGTGG